MLKPLAVLGVSLALAGCTTSDLVERLILGGAVAAQGLFISETDEIKIGTQTTAKVLSQMPEYPNPDVRDYVQSLGQKMVARSERAKLPFVFRVVESKEVNAFAAPGGFIFVTTSALRLMANEAQLATVLAHEVAHVAKKHAIGDIQKALIAQGITTAVLKGNDSKLVEVGANLASTLVLKGFDRGAELEADAFGAQYAYGNGYDPRELGTFLGTLARTSGETPAWLIPLAEHPLTGDRLTQLSTLITEKKWNVEGMTKGEASFKARILDKLGAASPAPLPSSVPTGSLPQDPTAP